MTKLFLLSTLALGLALSLSDTARADEADRNFIRGRLSFFFVANPNDNSATADQIDVDKVLKNTGTGAIYTDPSLAKFRNIIKALVGPGPVAGAGDLNTLQDVVASTLKITLEPIAVYMIDDQAAQLTNNANMNRFGICIDTNKRAWPCADTYTQDDRASHAWGGNLTVGAWHFNNSVQFSNLKTCISTICHELMHTQDLSDMRLHMFGAFMYGKDQKHYDVEATPDVALTYKEGIADFAAYWYDRDEVDKTSKWFDNNGYIVVEKVAPFPAKTPELYLYATLKAAGIQEVIPPASDNYKPEITTNYAFYNIRSLPAKVIAQNEQIVAMVLYEQSFYTSFTNVIAAIDEINPGTYRTSTSAWALLISRLCVRALPLGRTVEQLGRTEYKEPKTYFLPLAICDYYTSFRSNNKADFRAVFEDLPTITPWVDAYFDSGARDEVKAAVNASAPKFDDIDNMASALGITTPRVSK